MESFDIGSLQFPNENKTKTIGYQNVDDIVWNGGKHFLSARISTWQHEHTEKNQTYQVKEWDIKTNDGQIAFNPRISGQDSSSSVTDQQPVANVSMPATGQHSTEQDDIVHLESTISNVELTKVDLLRLSSSELTILRNEVYARHGYRFKTPALLEYFKHQPWYSPNTNEENVAHSRLNAIERRNVAFIKDFEIANKQNP